MMHFSYRSRLNLFWLYPVALGNKTYHDSRSHMIKVFETLFMFCLVWHLSGAFYSEKKRLQESGIADNMF